MFFLNKEISRYRNTLNSLESVSGLQKEQADEIEDKMQ